ncbi:hypothetical protein DFH08DRAFT_800079 [Mycena albidolilacea]|uniref:Uncharacterized protein n=1 Tax=Mycena albidolilacea TaxID=1033008 RepID=A0AAD7AMS6_9AGAR|nr:hypothetical protein DFH08DRAFT_800079 [Mycena albidolilacea]
MCRTAMELIFGSFSSIKARSFPRFWFYSFHYMDYQRYAFKLLTNSDLRGLLQMLDAHQRVMCTVSGSDVLDYLDIGDISYGSGRRSLLGLLSSIALRCILPSKRAPNERDILVGASYIILYVWCDVGIKLYATDARAS